MSRSSWIAIALCLLAVPAWAGLRPLYGGELVLTVPAAPQTTVPAQAWSATEVVLANALGGRLASVTEGTPTIAATSIRFTLRGDAVWPDGSVLDGRSLSNALKSALNTAPVSLPPFTFHPEGRELVVEFPSAADPMRYLDLPWLRLMHGSEGGPFRMKKNGIDANANGLGGRAFADRIRLDVRESRKLEATPDGFALLQPGTEGRAVFALPRPKGPAQLPIASALGGVDRTALSRLFVRTASHVPEGWPVNAGNVSSAVEGPIVLAVDASERDQKTVAERLQVLFRDRRLTVRIIAEDRATYFARLARGDYDLALVALPPAPKAVQAATLLRLASGKAAADQFWVNALSVSGARQEEALLRDTANQLGAALLYVEEGGIARGGRVHDATIAAPWDVDFGNAWLAPAGIAP